MSRVLIGRLAAVCFSLLFLAQASSAQRLGTEDGEWRYWGGDEGSSRYSPLDQIDASNFEDLEVVWRWKGANYGPEPDFIYRATPLKVGDRLYTVAGQRRAVVAIDAGTGETLWMWRMKDNPRWEASTRKNYGKGVAYAEVDGRGVVYVVTPGYYMAALDADTGQPLPWFGNNGIVDLHLGMGDYPVHPERGILAAGDITSSSAPIVINGVIVVGNSHDRGYYPRRMENVPGHVRGYDAKTGDMLWRFNVVPTEDEEYYDTWENGSAEYSGNVSVWAPLSGDSERNEVYVTTDTPTNDYYGGDRLGDNLYGTSIIALDVTTGEKNWHFQMVHHDIWNYDNPNAPKVLDVAVEGQGRVPMVIETTKQGWAYVFNRATGEPVWPIEERPVPQSDVPTERTSPTQPFPTKPAAFEMQGVVEENLIDFTPELRAEALQLASVGRMGPMFNPPSLANAADGTRGAFHAPGANGGANIPGGSSVDPENGILFVASQRGHSLVGLVPGSESTPRESILCPDREVPCASSATYVSNGFSGIPGPRGLPLLKPPYGAITAIDLKTGEHLWRIPNGDTPDAIRNHPALQGLDIPNTGKDAHANILTTRTLMIYGEGRGQAPILRAVDKFTGEEVGRIEIPAPTNTAFMSYMHEGRQFIVMAVAGNGIEAELVALALPEFMVEGDGND